MEVGQVALGGGNGFRLVLDEEVEDAVDVLDGGRPHLHFEAITQGYRTALAKAATTDEIRPLDRLEIETITLMLMAQRAFYGLRLKSAIDEDGNIDGLVVEIYLDLLRRVLRD